MPSHKTLKSITHNFAHSLISLMNYVYDDYFLGHVLKQMRTTNLNRLEIDILNKNAKPKELFTDSISQSIKNNVDWFPRLVKDGGSSMDYIHSANLYIEFDLDKSRPYHYDNSIIENPYICEIIIIDDREKEYKRKFEGWWFPES